MVDEYSKKIFKLFRGKMKKLEDIFEIEKAIKDGQTVSAGRKAKLEQKEMLNQSVSELTQVLELYK